MLENTVVGQTLLQQGREEGYRDGRIETLREDIEDVLLARFHHVPTKLVKKLARLKAVSALRLLHLEAVRAEDLEAFEAFLDESLKA